LAVSVELMVRAVQQCSA